MHSLAADTLFIWRGARARLRSRFEMAKPKKGAPVPVVVMGLGFIGQEVARAALSSEEVELIGAVDVSPHLAGKKLSDVLHRASTWSLVICPK